MGSSTPFAPCPILVLFCCHQCYPSNGPAPPLQSLPVEVYRSREELERLSVAELKRLLEVGGFDTG